MARSRRGFGRLVAFAVAGGIAVGTIAAVLIATRRNGDDTPSENQRESGRAKTADTASVRPDDTDVLPPQNDGAAEVARYLDDLGKSAIEKKDYEGALADFEEAYRILPEPKYLFNLATVNSALKHFSESLRLAKKVLTIDPSPELAAKTRSLIERDRVSMKARHIPETD